MALAVLSMAGNDNPCCATQQDRSCHVYWCAVAIQATLQQGMQ